MEASPLISVIIPCYNVEKYIGKAIDSIVSQSFQDFEIILVNDKSKDKTLDVIRDYEIKDKRINVINLSQNTGSAYIPRKIAAEAARGVWLHCLDADDYDDKDLLKSLYERAISTNAEVVYATAKFVKEDGTVTDNQLPLKSFDVNRVLSGLEALNLTIGKWLINANGCLVKRDVFLKSIKDHNINKVYIYSDEILTRIILLNTSIVSFVSSFHFRRENPTSVTHKVSVSRYEILPAYKQLVDIVKEKFPNDELICDKAYSMLWKYVKGSAACFEKDKRQLSQLDCLKIESSIKEHWMIIKSEKANKSLIDRILLYKWAVIVFAARLISLFRP